MNDKNDWRSPTERRAYRFVQRGENDPQAMRRGERIPGGRWILRVAERTKSGDWEPGLKPSEQLKLNRIAERLTMLGGRTPGRLFLTDQRLIFEPVMQPIWFPLSVEMRRDGLRVRRSGLVSRFLHLRGLDPAVAPTYLHVDDIKISRGRKAAWFRVYDAEEWKRALANP